MILPRTGPCEQMVKMIVPPCCYYRFDTHRHPTTKSYPNLRCRENDNNVFENLLKKYPDLFQFCCLCWTRRRRAIGLADIGANGQTQATRNGEIAPESGTPIIPITIPPDIDKYHQIDTNVQLESSHQQQLQQQQQQQQHKPQQTITENGNNVIGRYTSSSTSSSKQVDSGFHASSTDNRLHHHVTSTTINQHMAYESQTEESQEASTDQSRNATPEGEDDDEPEPVTIISLKKSESYHQLSQTQASTPTTMRPKSVLSEKIAKSEDEVDFKTIPRPASEAHGRLIRTASSSTFILDQTLEATNVEEVPVVTPKSRPTTAKPPQSPFRQIAAQPSANDIDDASTNSVCSGLDEAKSEFGSNQTLEIAENVTTATPSPAGQNFDDIPIDLHKSKENLVDTFALQLSEMPDQALKAGSKRPSKLTRTKKVSPTGGNKPTTDRMKRPNDLFPRSLRKVDRPRESLSHCLVQLDSPSWDITMNGLQMFVRLIRHHPEVVDAQMHLTAIALAKHIKNLRSQVARAACQAAGEFFVTHSKTIDHESEDIAAILLHRTADTNKFLRNDATKALENMSDQLPPSKTIHILSYRGATHPNAVVRSNASKLLARHVEQLGADKVFTLNRECREKLILTGANLLMEGSLDTRNYTKHIFRTLSTHPNYGKTLLEVIPPNIYRNIEKTLKSIK